MEYHCHDSHTHINFAIESGHAIKCDNIKCIKFVIIVVEVGIVGIVDANVTFSQKNLGEFNLRCSNGSVWHPSPHSTCYSGRLARLVAVEPEVSNADISVAALVLLR